MNMMLQKIPWLNGIKQRMIEACKTVRDFGDPPLADKAYTSATQEKVNSSKCSFVHQN